MAPSEILDAALVLTAIVWIGLAAVILIDRALYDRWARRIAMLRGQLIHASDTALERLAAGVTVDEFYQLVLGGVPSNVETALGRALLSRGRHPAILQLALGASRADVWKRIRAAQILASARTDDVYHPLDKMLRSGDGVLAAAALRLLVRLDDRPSAEMTVQALRDGVHSRSRIAAAFNAMSVDRADTLDPLFISGDPSCRYWAARLVYFLRAHQWAPRVRELMADRDPFVRRAAVEAIGLIGSHNDAKAVLDLFSDPAPVVRAHAARAAGEFSGARITAALRALLNDDAWIVRAAATEVLSARSFVSAAAASG